MLKAEAQLESEIAALLRKAELIDALEDRRLDKGKCGVELAKELRRRQDRIQVLRKAKAELGAEPAADHARTTPLRSPRFHPTITSPATHAAADQGMGLSLLKVAVHGIPVLPVQPLQAACLRVSKDADGTGKACGNPP